MSKIKVETSAAPGAIGPYSQGIDLGNLVFVSGQLPVDPDTGIMPEGVEAQTAQSLRNLRGILDQAGSSLEQVVKTTVFLQDMNDFAAVNQVYAQAFQGTVFPADPPWKWPAAQGCPGGN